jgi:hypothetical protein
VSELKERIDAYELGEYTAFEQVFGPLTVQERVDVAGAVAGWSAARSAGANVDLEAFVPNWSRKANQQPVDQMIAVMRGLQRKGNGGVES